MDAFTAKLYSLLPELAEVAVELFIARLTCGEGRYQFVKFGAGGFGTVLVPSLRVSHVGDVELEVRRVVRLKF